MNSTFEQARALALLIAANATPVVAGKLMGSRWSAPLDFGYVLTDQRRLFGDHKTWRGLLSGMCVCGLVATLFQISIWLGVGFAAASLLADAFSSAIKRRFNFAPGTEVLGLDHLGETFIPLIVFAVPLSLDAIDVVIVGTVFIALDLAVAPLRHIRWTR